MRNKIEGITSRLINDVILCPEETKERLQNYCDSLTEFIKKREEKAFEAGFKSNADRDSWINEEDFEDYLKSPEYEH